MAQSLSGFLPAAHAGETQQSPRRGFGELPWTVHAVSDAHSLTLALNSNLERLSKALGSSDSRLHNRMGEQVELCRQLAALLAGAIGCYSDAATTLHPRLVTTRLAELVDAVIERVSGSTNLVRSLAVSEGDQDLCVFVDSELMGAALERLMTHWLNWCGGEGRPFLSYNRCGSYAVLAVTVRAAPCDAHGRTEDLGQSESAELEGRFFEGFSDLSSTLAAQGGHLDVEWENDKTLTAYLVLTAVDQSLDGEVTSGIEFASVNGVERGGVSASDQERSETMMVKSDRFGAMEVETNDLLSFPSGIIGFPQENQFVLVRKAESQMIGWLQSTQSSYLALPVVSVHAFSPRYPDVAIEEFADRAGLGSNIDELAVLGVLSAPPGQLATVNLMAPIIVNAVTRVGAQVMLEGTRFSTREAFILPAASPIEVEARDATSGETKPTPSASGEVKPTPSATSAAE